MKAEAAAASAAAEKVPAGVPPKPAK
jgi:hypothetical protein